MHMVNIDWDLIINATAALGTLGSALAAVYFGAIQPKRREASFKISGFRVVDFHSYQDPRNIGRAGDMAEVGFFVEQVSGGPSSKVTILVKKVWFWDFDSPDQRKDWEFFIPSNLSWATKQQEVSFTKGTQRFCRLGDYGDPPSNDFVGAVFGLATTENKGDPLFGTNSNLLPSDKAKIHLELLLSGENVKPQEFTLEIKLYSPDRIGLVGDDGLPTPGNVKDAVEVKLISGKGK